MATALVPIPMVLVSTVTVTQAAVASHPPPSIFVDPVFTDPVLLFPPPPTTRTTLQTVISSIIIPSSMSSHSSAIHRQSHDSIVQLASASVSTASVSASKHASTEGAKTDAEKAEDKDEEHDEEDSESSDDDRDDDYSVPDEQKTHIGVAMSVTAFALVVLSAILFFFYKMRLRRRNSRRPTSLETEYTTTGWGEAPSARNSREQHGGGGQSKPALEHVVTEKSLHSPSTSDASTAIAMPEAAMIIPERIKRRPSLKAGTMRPGETVGTPPTTADRPGYGSEERNGKLVRFDQYGREI